MRHLPGVCTLEILTNEKEFVARRDACFSRPQDQDDRTGELLAAAR